MKSFAGIPVQHPCCLGAAFATVFGTVAGIVHDPQHRPVSGSEGCSEGEVVRLHAKDANLM